MDVRFDLTNPDAGRKAYWKDHIPGAIFIDIEKDLSGKRNAWGEPSFTRCKHAFIEIRKNGN